MPRKKETLTLSVPPGTKAQLEAIADRLDIRWGKHPSPSGLVGAIAQQHIEVGLPFRLTSGQVQALRQSVKDLMDAGHVEEAKSVITLLLDRGTLTPPLRQSLMQQVSQPLEGWRIQLEQLIEQRQPFRLVYQNSQETTLEFTVRHAETIFYEKRFYLQIWCDETDDSTDLPELQHNRCLRLDRIQALLPTEGEWRSCCDAIEVKLQITGRLVRAYEAKENDLEDQLVHNNLRLITKKVINPFWFLREIQRYGSDCLVISPDAMRERHITAVKATLDGYDRLALNPSP